MTSYDLIWQLINILLDNKSEAKETSKVYNNIYFTQCQM